MESAELEARIAEVSKTIYSYCRAKTSTREEAEDLSQDILLNPESDKIGRQSARRESLLCLYVGRCGKCIQAVVRKKTEA